MSSVNSAILKFTFRLSHNLYLNRKLAGRTLFITGASRGIGKAIALKAAKDGANVVVAAKTAEPHPKLPGTIYTTAEESMYINSFFIFYLILAIYV